MWNVFFKKATVQNALPLVTENSEDGSMAMFNSFDIPTGIPSFQQFLLWTKSGSSRVNFPRREAHKLIKILQGEDFKQYQFIIPSLKWLVDSKGRSAIVAFHCVLSCCLIVYDGRTTSFKSSHIPSMNSFVASMSTLLAFPCDKLAPAGCREGESVVENENERARLLDLDPLDDNNIGFNSCRDNEMEVSFGHIQQSFESFWAFVLLLREDRDAGVNIKRAFACLQSLILAHRLSFEIDVVLRLTQLIVDDLVDDGTILLEKLKLIDCLAGALFWLLQRECWTGVMPFMPMEKSSHLLLKCCLARFGNVIGVIDKEVVELCEQLDFPRKAESHLNASISAICKRSGDVSHFWFEYEKKKVTLFTHTNKYYESDDCDLQEIIDLVTGLKLKVLCVDSRPIEIHSQNSCSLFSSLCECRVPRMRR